MDRSGRSAPPTKSEMPPTIGAFTFRMISRLCSAIPESISALKMAICRSRDLWVGPRWTAS